MPTEGQRKVRPVMTTRVPQRMHICGLQHRMIRSHSLLHPRTTSTFACLFVTCHVRLIGQGSLIRPELLPSVLLQVFIIATENTIPESSRRIALDRRRQGSIEPVCHSDRDRHFCLARSWSCHSFSHWTKPCIRGWCGSERNNPGVDKRALATGSDVSIP